MYLVIMKGNVCVIYHFDRFVKHRKLLPSIYETTVTRPTLQKKSFTRFRAATRINDRWQLSQLFEWPVASVLEVALNAML